MQFDEIYKAAAEYLRVVNQMEEDRKYLMLFRELKLEVN